VSRAKPRRSAAVVSGSIAGVDLSVPDQVDELRQDSAHRSRPAVQVHVREEQLLAGQGTGRLAAPMLPTLPCPRRAPHPVRPRLLGRDPVRGSHLDPVGAAAGGRGPFCRPPSGSPRVELPGAWRSSGAGRAEGAEEGTEASAVAGNVGPVGVVSPGCGADVSDLGMATPAYVRSSPEPTWPDQRGPERPVLSPRSWC
jgi:hypothetical protein